MTTQDLFRCIGDLSDTMIEEAADIRRKKCWLPIVALAACAVLAISIPLGRAEPWLQECRRCRNAHHGIPGER